MIKITLPAVVTGFDLETLALRPDAYILTAALSTIDIISLEFLLHTYVKFSPTDPVAKDVFYVDSDTEAYWKGMANPDYAPSKRAQIEAFSGTELLPEGLPKLVNHVEQFKNKGQVIVSRGPDFDMPIIRNALQQCDCYQGAFMKVSMFDSDRTAERLAAAAGFEINEEVEKRNWVYGGYDDPHMAPHDAAKEAYTTARAYHLMMVGKQHGWDKAVIANQLLREGSYQSREFLNR